ncbi:MAG: DegV family protein [Gaiellales bacterium]
MAVPPVTSARHIALALAQGGAAAVEASSARLNDLNVYPVPDGDTGSNLAHTAARLAAGLESSPASDREQLAATAKRAALAGASGNSGIILSQIVAGFADVMGPPGEVDQALLARALRAATDAAYRPVRQPIEGTMLTVIRVMAETAEAMPGASLDEVVDAVLEAAGGTVERTQEMLDVLRDAGVVDAGAAGLVEFARGAVAAYRGQHIAGPQATLTRPLTVDMLHQQESRFRYCTAFLVEGPEVDPAALERALSDLGDSLLVVGEPPLVKVHIHTDDPGRALSLGVAMGALDGVDVANMHEQSRARERRLTVIEGGTSGDEPLTTATAALVLDSTADLPHAERVHANWRVVPLTVRFGDHAYLDGVDLDGGDFYRLLRESPHHPSTAAPGPGVYHDVFAELAGYRRVFVLPVSSRISASHTAAVAAAADDPRVSVLDGLTVSAGTLLLAEGIQRMLEEGAAAGEIEQWVAQARDRLGLLIAVDTLEYLRRGGRIGRLKHVAGMALGVRPLLTLRDGEVAQYGTVIGRRAVWKAFERFLCERAGDGAPARVAIAHADCRPQAEQLADMVRRLRPAATVENVVELGAAVGTHGGPGTIGMAVL